MEIGAGSNSNATKLLQEEKKKVEPVVSSPVKQKKKSGPRKFLDLFVSEEREDIKTYIILDVLVPTVKDAIYNMLAGGLSMALFGNASKSSKSTSSKISYASYYDRERRPQRETRPRLGYDFDEIILNSRSEAEEVLSRMDELISSYGVVSVADFYDLVDITGNYTDNKYGWNDIRNASVVRVRDGYVIKFPKALPLT